MNNKILQNFLSGFLSCFKFVPPFVSYNKDFEKSWHDNWVRVGWSLSEAFKKLEKEYERN
ncbi:MAG: hypothetical protein K0R02_540 [Rickettsiaceae bacterium]|jgi:hypothetical protein|nr:hypothetical protein [Rickettsiaceae bacterium]